jgi:DNA-directed RNA polymerase beta subunit
VATRSTSRERYSFANLDEPLELPDLIAIQRESFRWFLEEGLAQTFRDISPIKDFSEALQLELEFDPFDEDLRPPPKFTVEECKEKDMTYSAPIFVRARFMNRNTGEIKEQTVFMGDLPAMTEKGTFIINGTERVVVSQLVRSPGVIFEPGERYRLRNLTKHQLVKGTIHPYRGEWMEFDVEQRPGKDVTCGTRVARKRRLGIFTLLRALGFDEANPPASSRSSSPSSSSSRVNGTRSAMSPRARTKRSSRSTSAPAPASRPPSNRPAPISATPSSRTAVTTSRASAGTSSTASSEPRSPRLPAVRAARQGEPARRATARPA